MSRQARPRTCKSKAIQEISTILSYESDEEYQDYRDCEHNSDLNVHQSQHPDRQEAHLNERLVLRFPRTMWNSYSKSASPKPSHGASALQFSQHVWNSYERPSSPEASSFARSLTPQAPREVKKEEEQEEGSPDCKTKLFSFQYGGEGRSVSGSNANDIELKGPCFEDDCLTCSQWNFNRIVFKYQTGSGLTVRTKNEV
ncbi:hypothetical protein BU24DRAFT_429007 [Aaosphaeria arxii CBS 175.79]|uniref:Uncharacterized protein n=1 Tax=Aaosphaeria arxii CBS 175.79 TaxID=1450172 RepID=A0A6A5X846_9PLEO|nr:uncharacterized protein BU24DRAFT_429007 [Aaosphaeria arxii CBS 175.79]KAF2009069.1 hypothetical protein BU24DRAFT_429007 [Aaosphaeria arxii CBS 175.79]